MAQDALAALQGLGFSEYEARAYAALVERGPLNGYELAKQSKVPRPNVYAVVEKLLDRGAVQRVDLRDGTRYIAVEPQELSKRLRARYAALSEAMGSSLASLASSVERPPIVNIHGRRAFLEEALAVLESARESLLVAVWPSEAAALATAVSQAESRGVQITTLCLAACAWECGGCRGALYRYRVAAPGRTRSLIVVADGATAFAGQTGDADALAVRTMQPLVVELATMYIRNTIALAALVHDVGTRLGDLARPETLTLLDALGPAHTDMMFPFDEPGAVSKPA